MVNILNVPENLGVIVKSKTIHLIGLTGKDPDAEEDWRQEEKGTTEDERVGWHHWFDGHEFEQAPGVGDGQGSLVCCSPWGRKESDRTEQLNWLTDPPQFSHLWNDGLSGNGEIKITSEFRVLGISKLILCQGFHWLNASRNRGQRSPIGLVTIDLEEWREDPSSPSTSHSISNFES